jgi:hypothetical protein
MKLDASIIIVFLHHQPTNAFFMAMACRDVQCDLARAVAMKDTQSILERLVQSFDITNSTG